MTYVLDAGALIAAERGDRELMASLKAAALRGDVPITHGGVVGQVWRGGSRQARLSALLAGMAIQPLDDQLGRAAGALLAATGQSDVIDAALVLLARDGDRLLTGDPADLVPLVTAAGQHVDIIDV